MGLVVFNFHDVILLMTAMQCAFFASLLIATNTKKTQSAYFLALFLIAHSLISLHELILWGAVFKLKVREQFPGAYFIGGFAYYLDAVLLYFYVRSQLFSDFKLKKFDLIHLAPLGAFFLFMCIAFYSQSAADRLDAILDESFVYGKSYISADFLSKSIRVLYCVLSLMLLLRYTDRLKSTHSDVDRTDAMWLKLLVVGFLVVTIMELILSISKVVGLFTHHDLEIFSTIGLTGYYTTFALINVLVFTATRYFTSFVPVEESDQNAQASQTDKNLFNPDFANNISQIMESNKPYLNPDITLEMLANEIAISSKQLSMTINQYFKKNFYEFINEYRIEEAKNMLASPEHNNKTITDIYLAVGFNSKSVFNTFFKKKVGETPSQYRKKQAAELG